MFDPETGPRIPNYKPSPAPLPPAGSPAPSYGPQPYGADATPQPTAARIPYPGWKPGMPRNPRNLPPHNPAPPPGTPGTPTPGTPSPSAAATPFQPFQPQAPGGGGGAQRSPWDMPPMMPQQGGSAPQAGNFDDPFNQFLSAVPLMNLNMNKQISDAMAQAGFGGTRYGTAAMGKAGEIGAENSLAQNQMLTSMLSDFANKSKDRQLQATGMSAGIGGLLDQMQQNRVGTLAGLGQTEQGRQDQFANTRFQDWSTNRLGWLPLLVQAFSGQHAGSPGQMFTTQTPGTPSTISQYGPLLTALLGGG